MQAAGVVQVVAVEQECAQDPAMGLFRVENANEVWKLPKSQRQK